jgi:hypothetical protein
MTKSEYRKLYYLELSRNHNNTFEAARSVLEHYAAPPKYLLQPQTWFRSRTWKAVVLQAIENTLNSGSPSIELLFRFLSEAFADPSTRTQLNAQGDFIHALTALQSAIPGLRLHRFPCDLPFLELAPPQSPQETMSLCTFLKAHRTSWLGKKSSQELHPFTHEHSLEWDI